MGDHLFEKNSQPPQHIVGLFLQPLTVYAITIALALTIHLLASECQGQPRGALFSVRMLGACYLLAAFFVAFGNTSNVLLLTSIHVSVNSHEIIVVGIGAFKG